jgi:hypothetical protein
MDEIMIDNTEVYNLSVTSPDTTRVTATADASEEDCRK